MLYVALRCVDNLKTLFTPFLPVQLAARCTSCSATTGWIAGPLEFRDRSTRTDGTSHTVLTGDYASWVGSLGAERRCPPGQELREPRAALPQARPETVVAEELERMDEAAAA